MDYEEGARNALSGFLYQILATAAFQATAQDLDQSPTELYAELTLIRNGTLSAEALTQDIVIEGELGQNVYRIAIQVKYSRLPNPPPISDKDLRKIANKFVASDRCSKSVGCAIDWHVLVTNRRLSESADASLIRARSAAESARTGSTPPVAKYKKVLGSLRHVLMKKQEWNDQLRRFAHSYGATEEEVRDGTSKLIGHLYERMSSPPVTVSPDALREAFCHFKAARRVTAGDLAPFGKESLDRFNSEGSLDRHLIRRSIVDLIAEKVQNHALVVVHGDGGRGKSAAVYQTLCDRLDGARPRVAFLSRAEHFPQLGLGELIARWRGLPPAFWGRDTDDVALGRLVVANPENERPILVLSVDGLDEVPENLLGATRRLVQFFWEAERRSRVGTAHPASLIVTCRNEETVLKDWLSLGSGGFTYDGLMPARVGVGDFSQTELAEAIARWAPPNVAEHFSELAGLDYELSTVRGSVSKPVGSKRLWPVIDSLRHPILWRAFARITDQGVQMAVLDGIEDALSQLAHEFVEWFCSKAHRRLRESNATLSVAELRQMLYAIGKAYAWGGGSMAKHTYWVQPAGCGGHFGPGQCERSFGEAMSSGLIKEVEAGRWIWRHNFVGRFLATCSVKAN